MFKLYNDKFGVVTLKPTEPPSTGKKKIAWDDIFSSAGDNDDYTSDIFSSPGNNFCTPPFLNSCNCIAACSNH
jgi:hypothetical protein